MNRNFGINMDSLNAQVAVLQKQLSNMNFSQEFFGRISELQSMIYRAIPEKLIQQMSKLAEEERENENLSVEEFEAKYGPEREKARKLGENGWVISQHTNPRIMREWYEYLDSANADENIMKYFTVDEERILDSIKKQLGKIYTELPYCRYYTKGMDAFENGEYMTAAMCFCPLFERRMGYLINPEGRGNKNKYTDNGFSKKREDIYEDGNYFSNKYLILDMFPSLTGYAYRLFVEDSPYKFGQTEPPYLNRNWLLHGRMSREVNQCDCVQLLNALSVLEFLCEDQEKEKPIEG